MNGAKEISSEDYLSVTEISGDEVTKEQIDRLCNRYYWAGRYCKGRDVVEVACGTSWRIVPEALATLVTVATPSCLALNAFLPTSRTIRTFHKTLNRSNLP